MPNREKGWYKVEEKGTLRLSQAKIEGTDPGPEEDFEGSLRNTH